MASLGIVDDHPLFLDGVRQFLTANGHRVDLIANNADSAMAALQALADAKAAIDVLIMDVSMYGGGGLELLSRLRTAGYAMPTIFLTVGMTSEDASQALSRGINGIVLKDSAPAVLLSCVNAVLTGQSHIDARLMERAMNHNLSSASRRPAEDIGLTVRETEIVGLIRQGLRNRAIADQCGLSEGTIKVHLHNIFRKTGVTSRAELIVSEQHRK